MDFHSLARKELQALCKKNKIPANLTNVAMADALKALVHVERGLSEIPDEPMSSAAPKRQEMMILLSEDDVPRSSTRKTTATRRKQPVVSGGETETSLEKIDVIEITDTPVPQNHRRRTSTQRKPVAETESDTPVTRNGRRKVVRGKIETTHMKESNEEEEEEKQKEENLVVVPVRSSVRRSTRVSENRVPPQSSIQMKKKKKGCSTRRAEEAVTIQVFSEEEEEAEEGSKEISVLEEEKGVTEHRGVSGDVFSTNRTTETFNAAEEKRVFPESIQKKKGCSRRTEAKEDDSEISLLEEENKVTEHTVSGDHFNNKNETFDAEEESSEVVDSTNNTPLETSLPEEICNPTIEEETVTENVADPLAREVQGSGSLETTEEKKEKEEQLHGLSEPGTIEGKDGAEEESSEVVSSNATPPLEETSLPEEICNPTIEEETVTENVVYVADPLAREVQGSGSLEITEEKKEKEQQLHGLSEPGTIEDKDGAEEESSEVVSSNATPPLEETSLPEEICNPTIEEEASATDDFVYVQGSGPMATTEEKEMELLHGLSEPGAVEVINSEEIFCYPASKESIADRDLIGNDEDSEVDDEDVESDEEGEEVTSDCLGSTLADEDDEFYEIQPLEATCFNLCLTKNPEMEGNKEECNYGSALAAIDEFVGEVKVLLPEKSSEMMQPLEDLGPADNLEMVGCEECDHSALELVLQLENISNQLAGVVLQSETDDSVAYQQQKINEGPELENVADPVPTTEIPEIEKHSENDGSSIDESKECFNEGVEDGTEMKAQSDSEGAGEQKFTEEAEKEGSDSVADEQQKMNEELESVADPVPTGILAIEKHLENESSFIEESKEDGTEINAQSDSEADPDIAVHVAKLCGELKEGSDLIEDIVFSSPTTKVGEEEKSCDVSDFDISSFFADEELGNGVVSSFSSEEQEERDFNATVIAATAASGDAISSTLHFENKISLPSPANNPNPTPTPKRSLKKTQEAPGKSVNEKKTPVRFMVFDDNKENNYEIGTKKLDLGIATPDTARVEKKKDVASILKGYTNISMRKLEKMVKEKEQQLENKRTALQTLNKNLSEAEAR